MSDLSVVAPSGDNLDAEQLATSPLVITYWLTNELSVQTTVVGEARNIATVAVMAGSIPAWSNTLTQIFPEAETTYPITVGNATIEQGAIFRLTIPTEKQPGQVTLQCTIDAQGRKLPFSAQIATWPLTG